jgi:TRAP-type uncharacterized transport system fused permease subunit
VYLLAGALQKWYFGVIEGLPRLALLVASVLLVHGGLITDVIGLGLAAALALLQIARRKKAALPTQ